MPTNKELIFNKKIHIQSPATVANIVCGFDILGFAVNNPFDEMSITLLKEPHIIIKNLDDYNLTTDPTKNVAGVALQALMDQFLTKIGFEIEIKKNIKPGSGVGSSAASSAGAVVGANYLLNNFYSKQELVQFAMCGEEVASGVKHADNIAPCIMGGITLIRSINPLDIIPLNYPHLFVTIVHPQIEIKTSDARSILKQQVFLKDAIKQWGNVAGLVAGFVQKDYDLIARSLEDFIIEPVRSILIPAFNEIKVQTKKAGALGGGISGSGPSIFMLSKDEKTALNIEKIMSSIYTNIGLEHHTYITSVNSTGVKIIEN
ncbi:MAG: homoserine kinase [Sediminibacterium sp.]|nr:homoserine kinase [Sediminibacterium sp.]